MAFARDTLDGSGSAPVGTTDSKQPQSDHYTSVEEWTRRICDHNGRIVWASIHEDVEAGSETVIGFVFVHDRPPHTLLASKFSVTTTRHIWLASTSPLARRRGVFRRLLDSVRKELEPLLSGEDQCSEHGVWTVNTVPQRYPHMPTVLSRLGFVEYGTESAEEDGVIVLYKRMYYRTDNN
ncbi:hypothetical protein HDU93_004939 [Gonapodya sp. JEL0774]|nr:hypothetical protein HDU93_004939 [Gonapodya sp. JEL0774]